MRNHVDYLTWGTPLPSPTWYPVLCCKNKYYLIKCRESDMKVLILMLVCLISACSTITPKPLHTEPLNLSWVSSQVNGYPRARLFSDKVAIYSILANDVYDEDIGKVVPIPFPTNEVFESLLPNEGLEEGIGFRGKAWLRYAKGKANPPEVIIVFRGTQFFEWSDWTRGNFVFIKGLFRTQFDAALDFSISVKKYLEKSNQSYSNVTLVGHSLGGGLAEYVQRFYKGSKAIVFNSSPNTGTIYSMLSDTFEKDVIRVHEEGEILQYLRPIVSPDFTYDQSPDSDDGIKTAWIDFFFSHPFAAHDMRDFSMKLIQASEIEGNASSVNVMNQVRLSMKK